MKNYIYIIISCLLCSNPIWADRQSNVQTPKGSSVEAWILDEMSNDDILMWNSHFTSRYPAAEMLAPSTNAYGSFSYYDRAIQHAYFQMVIWTTYATRSKRLSFYLFIITLLY